MMLAQMQNSPELQTVVFGLGGFVISMVVKDYIRDKFSNRKEDSKISELSQQTKLLQDHKGILEDIASCTRKQNRKMKKTLKRIDKNVQLVKKKTFGSAENPS